MLGGINLRVKNDLINAEFYASLVNVVLNKLAASSNLVNFRLTFLHAYSAFLVINLLSR